MLAGALVFSLGLAGQLPGAALARTIAEKLVCAAHLGEGCGGSRLGDAYGTEVAALIEEHVPVIRYERGMRALPVDFRRCRADSCAEGADSGSIWRSRTGQPVAAFTRVVDCRLDAPFAGDAGSADDAGAADCSGPRAGNAYLQYWFYYPGSATAEGSIPGVKEGIRWASTKLGKPTFHRDDWESFQVRISPGGEVLSRASSHQGHVYYGALGDSVRNQASRLESAADGSAISPGRAERGAWGPHSGSFFVSGGSHAGRIGNPGPSIRLTPGSRLNLIPLEGLKDRAAYGFAVTPPWLKKLWRDPEAESTD